MNAEPAFVANDALLAMSVLPFKLTVPVPVANVPEPFCIKLPLAIVIPVVPVMAPAVLRLKVLLLSCNVPVPLPILVAAVPDVLIFVVPDMVTVLPVSPKVPVAFPILLFAVPDVLMFVVPVRLVVPLVTVKFLPLATDTSLFKFMVPAGARLILPLVVVCNVKSAPVELRAAFIFVLPRLERLVFA